MKTVIVHKTPVDLEEYVQRSAAEADIKQLVSEPSIIIDGDTDEVLAIYADLPQDPAKLTRTLKAIKYDTSERTAGLKTTCVQLSDDLKGLKRAVDKKQTAELTVEQAIRLMISELESKDLYLAGVAPTANPYFYNPDKRVRTDKFIVGDFIVVRPSEQRFDTNMTLKEDYDFTMQHIVAHGGVVRYDAILAEFAHRTNSGGAVSYRTPNKEQFNIDYLKEKWPGAIVDNPKRPNEILLKPEKYQHG